ncbi:MAG: ABC transporter substrate-binding protein [Candidatus Aenigmarchaeota archaeon]|nr:ABC transporter substrate-binding protein [Candidatus Aenigmarchaeota archaeon]
MIKKLFISVLAIIFVSFLVYIFQSKPETVEDIKISLPEGKFLNTYFPLYVAQHKNFFQEQKLNVSLVFTDPGNSVYQVVAGDVQFASLIPSSISSMMSGNDLKIVMTFSKDDVFFYSNLSSVEELRGKKIAVPSTGTISYAKLSSFLKNSNISVRDVRIFTISNVAERVQAFELGTVDALTATNLAFEPGEVKMAVYLGNYTSDKAGGVVAAGDYIKENPETVMKLVTAIAESVNYIYDNSEDSIRLLESAFSIDEQRARDVYKFILDNEYYTSDLDLQALDEEAKELATAQGRVPINIENFVDKTFVDNLPENLLIGG